MEPFEEFSNPLAFPIVPDLLGPILCDRVRPIPGMIPIPGTNTRYLYLYEKNRYDPAIGSVWGIWGISVQ